MENALQAMTTDRQPVRQEQSYDPAKTLLVAGPPLRPQQQRSAGAPTEGTNTDHSRDELVISNWTAAQRNNKSAY